MSETLERNLDNPEQDFKLADGSIDTVKAHAALQEMQAKGEHLTQDDIRYCIRLVRILRRTNTGPAASKTRKKPAVNLDPNADILDL